jgi:hypothetical protein
VDEDENLSSPGQAHCRGGSPVVDFLDDLYLQEMVAGAKCSELGRTAPLGCCTYEIRVAGESSAALHRLKVFGPCVAMLES